MNNRGFNTIELMINIGIASIVAAGVATLTNHQTKATRGAQLSSVHIDLKNEIQRALSNSSICGTLFKLGTGTGELNISPGFNGSVSLFHPSGASFLSSGMFYQGLRVSSVGLTVAASPVTTGSNLYSATLTVNTQVPQIGVTYLDSGSVGTTSTGGTSSVTGGSSVVQGGGGGSTPPPPPPPERTAFGVQSRSDSYNFTLVLDTASNSFNKCYNSASAEEISQGFCENSLGGTYDAQTEGCTDISIGGVPSPVLTCESHSRYCSTLSALYTATVTGFPLCHNAIATGQTEPCQWSANKPP